MANNCNVSCVCCNKVDATAKYTYNFTFVKLPDNKKVIMCLQCIKQKGIKHYVSC